MTISELPRPDTGDPQVKRKEKRTRQDRYMAAEVDDITVLDPDTVITFYDDKNTVRYYMRLLMPIWKRGILVYYPYRKGRPSYSFMAEYKLPPGNRRYAIVRKSLLPEKVKELLFNTVTNKELIEKYKTQIEKDKAREEALRNKNKENKE